ncbi:MAG TPA: class I SAM-dependent methyltransferase [Phycisphaerales bacterium]|nr:class I SAM-dependent methyltransferase [Phycisphaerales bacterium]
MNVEYWDAIAPNYSAQVLDTLSCDRAGVITAALDCVASSRKTAADFGCGIGGYSAALASRFKSVVGLDHSAPLIEKAKVIHQNLKNVEFRQADLTRTLRSWSPCDVGVCMNVLIMPDLQIRNAILRTIHRALKAGGTLLAVVPSLESSLYTDVRLIEWNMRDGMSHDAAVDAGLEDEPGIVGPPAAGVVETGGELTKHYLREEISLLMESAGFEVQAVEKVEYDWSTEFEHPPRWLDGPYPWDWLVTCGRS